MSTIIELGRVSKAFARRTILNDVTLAIEAGHTVGIVGSNGSGKSVLFQISPVPEKSLAVLPGRSRTNQ